MKDEIRWAYPHEGPVLYDILKDQNVPLVDWVDWTQPLGPFWLLLIKGLNPVGCINVNPGTPVGRLEWLVVKKSVPKRQYAIAIRDLLYAGATILQSQGSQIVAGQICDHEKGWQRVLQRRKFFPTEPGTLYIGVLQHGSGNTINDARSISSLNGVSNVKRE